MVPEVCQPITKLHLAGPRNVTWPCHYSVVVIRLYHDNSLVNCIKFKYGFIKYLRQVK